MLGHARRRGIDLDWTFYCTLGHKGALDGEARALGARVIHSEVPIVRKTAFVAALRAELRRGEYEVLHSHHDLVSAVYLLASAGIQIRRRVVPVHNGDEGVLTPPRLHQRPHREPIRGGCLFFAPPPRGLSQQTTQTFSAARRRR